MIIALLILLAYLLLGLLIGFCAAVAIRPPRCPDCRARLTRAAWKREDQ